MKFLLFLSILPLIFSQGCKDSGSTIVNNSSSSGLSFTQQSLEAVPLVDGGAFLLPSYMATTATSNTTVSNFFKLECHNDTGTDNYCPSSVSTTGSGMDNYKLTTTTLIGLIYHAQMYAQNIYSDNVEYTDSSCPSGSSSITVTSSSFTATTDGDKFILDGGLYNLYDCLYSYSREDNGTSYMAYNLTSDDTLYSMISTRKNDLSSAGWDQTDFFQVYLTKPDGTTPTILAFNHAGMNDAASDHFVRAVLLANLTNNRFAVVYKTGNSGTWLKAAGTGGINASTGTANSGYYWVQTDDLGKICVDNSTGADATAGDCAANPWTTGVATFLGLTAADTTNLATFISNIEESDIATNLLSPTHITNDLVNFPTTIE
jgi:hypothetical protein